MAKKLTEEEKKERAREYQRRWREKNPDIYEAKKNAINERQKESRKSVKTLEEENERLKELLKHAGIK